MFFYANDRDEPSHVHIEREKMVAKFWIDPVQLARTGGFSRAEVNYIQRIVEAHQTLLREAWRDYFES